MFYAYAHLDLNELDLPKTMKIRFPNELDLLNFELDISPDEGEETGYACRTTREYEKPWIGARAKEKRGNAVRPSDGMDEFGAHSEINWHGVTCSGCIALK